MTRITDLAPCLQTLLTRTADELAKVTGFVKRQREVSGASFAQTVVLGRLAEPDGTRRQLQQSAGLVGTHISVQGLDQRFTPSAVAFMRALVEAGLQQVITQEATLPPPLARFNGVYLTDGTRVEWQTGVGVKVGVRLDIQRGAMQLCLTELAVNDQKLAVADTTLPVGALHVGDLGFFKLKRFHAWSAAGVYWLTRYKLGTRLTTPDGQPIDLKTLLQGEAPLKLAVRMGTGANAVAGWLLAASLPPDERPKRLARLREQVRLDQRPLSQAQLDLACWTLYVTNVPHLSFELAHILGRTRWQIELLFKHWKSDGGLVRSRSADPIRQQVEGYAKLLGLLIAHWCLLVADWNPDTLSPVDALRLLRTHLSHLRYALLSHLPITDFFRFLRLALSNAAPRQPRRHRPLVCQLWGDFDLAFP